MTDTAYKRLGPGLPTEAEQDALLRDAGFVVLADTETSLVWTDRASKRKRDRDDTKLPQRDSLLAQTRPGDVVWIAFPGAFGATLADALGALRAITEHGGVLRIAGDPKEYRWHPDVDGGLALAERIAQDALNRRTAPAIKAARRKRLAGKDKPEVKAAWKLAEEMWPDLAHTVADIEKATGLSPSTLYRRQRAGDLPPRNAAPFVGGPGKIRRRGTR